MQQQEIKKKKIDWRIVREISINTQTRTSNWMLMINYLIIQQILGWAQFDTFFDHSIIEQNKYEGDLEIKIAEISFGDS